MIEKTLEKLLFACRWLLAPLYLGLALALIALGIKFFTEPTKHMHLNLILMYLGKNLMAVPMSEDESIHINCDPFVRSHQIHVQILQHRQLRTARVQANASTRNHGRSTISMRREIDVLDEARRMSEPRWRRAIGLQLGP